MTVKSTEPSNSPFRGWAGVARADITPPPGILARNWGAAAGDIASGIHRPLTATALTLQSEPGGQPLVIAALDLGWWHSAHDEWLLRGALLEALQLDESRLLVALSHTHAGPVLCRETTTQEGSALVAGYLDGVRDILKETIDRALRGARQAVLEWAYGRCNLAANRDLRDPERQRYVCGFNPGGQADDTLLVGRVSDEGGHILATLVNYACHPTTLAWQNSLISPDYVGAMRDVVEAQCGAPCLFLQGASGELAPAQQYTGDVEVADRHGRRLGFATLATLAAMPATGTRLQFGGVVESGAPLALWQPEERPWAAAEGRLDAVRVPVRLPLKKLPGAAQTALELEACTDRVLQERLRRRLRIARSVGDGATSAESLWVWRVGDALLAAQRNEPYSTLQTQLRAELAGRHLVVLGITNGTVGYLPPAELYDADLYPVWQTPYERGSLEILLEAARGALRDIVMERG